MELRVRMGPPGRWTLLRRRMGETSWQEIEEAGLTDNPDAYDFYKRTADYLGRLALKGVRIHYDDLDSENATKRSMPPARDTPSK